MNLWQERWKQCQHINGVEETRNPPKHFVFLNTAL